MKFNCKLLLLAAAVGMVVSMETSCSAGDSDEDVPLYNAKTPVRFEGQWVFDGQVVGRGNVSLDTAQVTMKFPAKEITLAVLANLPYSNAKPTIQATNAQQQMEAKYVGVSQTSRYYDLPATQMIIEAIVDNVPCNVRLQTANTGSVVLLQEEKHSLSMVVKIVGTTLEQSDNGVIVADSKKDHNLIFESDVK